MATLKEINAIREKVMNQVTVKDCPGGIISTAAYLICKNPDLESEILDISARAETAKALNRELQRIISKLSE